MNDVSEKACRDAAEQKRQILRAHFPWAEVGVATPESGHPDGAYRVRVESNGRVAYTFWNGWSPPDDIVAALHVFLERPAGPVSICDLHLWLPVFVGDASFPIESIDRSCADPVVGLRLPDGLREVRLSTIERCPNGNLAVKP